MTRLAQSLRLPSFEEGDRAGHRAQGPGWVGSVAQGYEMMKGEGASEQAREGGEGRDTDAIALEPASERSAMHRLSPLLLLNSVYYEALPALRVA